MIHKLGSKTNRIKATTKSHPACNQKTAIKFWANQSHHKKVFSNIILIAITMSISAQYMCKWCGRDDFISQRGLTYHLERSRICYATAKAASSPDIGAINTKVPLNRHNKGDAIMAKSFHNRCIINDPKSLLKSHDLDDVACVIGAYFDDGIEDLTANESGQNVAESSDKEASDSGQNQSETIEEHNLENKGPDTGTRDQFNGDVKRITGHFLAFSQAEKASIQLMHTL